MLSQTAEYALRAMVWLSANRDRPQTTREIAAATHVPAGYLSKVLQSLGRSGLVRSRRGLHGGFTLGGEPSEITVLDVINVAEPLQRIHRCPLGLQSHGEKLCALHQRVDDAIAAVEKAFASSTLEELLADASTSQPLCDGP